MRYLKKLSFAAAAASLVVAGTASAASTHSVNMLPTSSVAQRASAPVAGETSELRGGSSWLLGLLAAVAIVGGIIILADGDDEADSPG